MTLGGTIGHAICTGLAVVGGRLIAQRISIRTGELFIYDSLLVYLYPCVRGKNKCVRPFYYQFAQGVLPVVVPWCGD